MSPRETATYKWAYGIMILLMLVVGVFLANRLDMSTKEIKAENVRLVDALQCSGQGLWSWPINTGELWVGPNFTNVIDTAEKPATLASFIDKVLVRDQGRLLYEIRKCQQLGQGYQCDFGFVTETGDVKTLRAVGRVVEQQNKLCMSGAIIDISAETLANERAKVIVNSSALAIVMCDEGRKITLYNDVAEHVFGWTQQEAIGLPIDILIAEKQLEQHRTAYAAAISNMMSHAGDFILRRSNCHGIAVDKSGHEFPVSFDLRAIKHHGKIEFVAGFTRDGDDAGDNSRISTRDLSQE